jgi:hypothetical protein
MTSERLRQIQYLIERQPNLFIVDSSEHKYQLVCELLYSIKDAYEALARANERAEENCRLHVHLTSCPVCATVD